MSEKASSRWQRLRDRLLRRRGLRSTWPFLRQEWGRLAGAYAAMMVLAAATTVYSALAGPALQYVFSGSFQDLWRAQDGSLRRGWDILPKALLESIEAFTPEQALWILPVLLTGTALIKGLAQTSQFYLLGGIAQRVLLRLRQRSFNALMGQSPAFYEHRAHGDLLSRLTHDAHAVEQALFYGCGALLRDTLSVVFLLAYCFINDAKLALFTFITVPLAVIPLNRFSRWLKKVSQRGQAAQGGIHAVCYEALAGHRVVQSFGREAYEATRLRQHGERYLKEMLRSYFIRAIRTPTMETLGAMALAALIAFLGHQVQAGERDAGHTISFFVAIVMLYEPLKRLGRVSDYLAAGSAAAERIFEIIDHPNPVQDPPNAAPLAPFHDAVMLHNVVFSYGSEPGAPKVLRGIDLTLQRGQCVALVGRSGSGKSTLAQLLCRFYDPQLGKITFDGRNLPEIGMADLRQQISVVSQETFLFNASVRDNIAYGRPEATPSDIEAAARAAHADDFIRALPQGYDTPIGERGITLSGGQRQRLAIARALLRDAPILILDEATSALDAESERAIQDALDELLKNRTALVIAHRLSTVRRADHIVVLEAGRIVEEGHHDALLARNGAYARLIRLQTHDLETESALPRSAIL